MIEITLISQYITANDQPHHLVGAFQNLVHAQIAQDALDWMIAQVAVAAVKLQAAIDDLEPGVSRKPLRLRHEARGRGFPPVDRDRRAPEEKPRSLEGGQFQLALFAWVSAP